MVVILCKNTWIYVVYHFKHNQWNYWNWEKGYCKGYSKGYCKSTKIIDAIKSNPKVTQEKLAEIVGITRKSVISNMKKLQENGLINRIGADKNGYWKVVE